ncbi:60S ribosomal protein L21-1 [Nymphaea thermarum]|nr:60S ribosomal protein L21-1 [Nymphaea thermarum]
MPGEGAEAAVHVDLLCMEGAMLSHSGTPVATTYRYAGMARYGLRSGTGRRLPTRWESGSSLGSHSRCLEKGGEMAAAGHCVRSRLRDLMVRPLRDKCHGPLASFLLTGDDVNANGSRFGENPRLYHHVPTSTILGSKGRTIGSETNNQTQFDVTHMHPYTLAGSE